MSTMVRLILPTLLTGGALGANNGYAIYFGSYLEVAGTKTVPLDATLLHATGDLTVSVWAKWRETSLNYAVDTVISTSADSNFFNGFGGFGGGFLMMSSGHWTQPLAATELLQWHHYTMTSSAGAVVYYVDGVQTRTQDMSAYTYVTDWTQYEPILQLGSGYCALPSPLLTCPS